MGETSLQSRFCALETRYEIKKKKCGLQSTKSTLETSLQSRFCALETRCEISKKKNVVSRAQKVPWRSVSRVDFVLWRPDMRLAKKKMWSPEHKKYPGDQSPE